MKHVFLLLTILLLWLPTSIYGEPEQLLFEQLTLEDGLPNSSVSSIVQDKYGFLWFGTQSGLAKYDGKSFTVFRHEPFNQNSLAHNLIQTMFLEKEKNILWLGTYQGLSRFNILENSFTSFYHSEGDPSSLSNNIVTAIARDQEGTLWVGTLNGLNTLNEQEGDFTHYYHHENKKGSLSNNVVRDICVDSQGRVWIGSYGGLDLYEPETDSFTHFRAEEDSDAGLPSPNVMSIKEEKPGVLWLGTWGGGLTRFDISERTFTSYSLPDNRVYDLNCQHDRYIWVATWGGGLQQYDRRDTTIETYTHDKNDPYGISHDVIYSLTYDESGILWIGTNGGGLNKLDSRRKNHLVFQPNPEDPDSLSEGKINAIHRDSHGILWVGTYNGGLNRYEENEERWIHYTHDPEDPHSLSNDIVTSIYEDRHGNLWIGTNGGYNKYNRDTDTFTQYHHREGDKDTVAGEIVYAFEEGPAGDLWIGTYNMGLSRYNYETGEFTHYPYRPTNPLSLSNNLVYSLFLDSTNTLWVGTNKGLNRYDPDRDGFKRYFHDPEDRTSLASDSVRTVFEDSKGRLWIGTNGGGLNRFHRESQTFTHYTTEDGLPDNTVLGILEGEENTLWVSTEYGLCIFIPQTEQFLYMDEDEGVIGKEFQSGYTKDQQGTLYFASNRGINAFEEARVLENTHKPPVHLTDFKVFNTSQYTKSELLTLDTIEISHDDNFISFEFAALDYAAPEKNLYAYKLEGFNADWVYSGSRNYTSFTNLPPGNYTFRVKASNNDGLWNEEGLSITLQVHPPFWRTPWAYSGYGIVTLLLIGLVVIQIKKRNRRKLEELERERYKKERERFYQLIELFPSYVFLRNQEGTIVYSNREFRELFGDPQGKYCYECVHQRSDVCEDCFFEEIFNTHETVQHEWNTEDGRTFLMTGIPFVDVDGTPLILITGHDITSIKEAEKLREDITRITRHDLKTPLSGMLGTLDLLEQDNRLTQEQREYVAMIEEAGRQMLTMINESLNLYKMEKGTFTFEPVPVAIPELLHRIVQDLHQEIEGRQVEVSIESAPVSVSGEYSLCYSLFSNLLRNAIDASETGDVVRVTSTEDDAHVSISIWNRLPIPEEVQPIFGQKYATSGKREGTGLGVYSARLMIETQGGTLTWHSTAEEGTTITVTLPRA